jgi:hypothetical protein
MRIREKNGRPLQKTEKRKRNGGLELLAINFPNTHWLGILLLNGVWGISTLAGGGSHAAGSGQCIASFSGM